MQFVQAFKVMGYDIENQRQDWSAEKIDGVCLTLWTKETDWKSLVMDTRVNAQDHAIWGAKFGNKKRIRHARRALDEFGGWVDIVKVDGDPGVSYGNAFPWLPVERMGRRWRITHFEEPTGHMRLEALLGG